MVSILITAGPTREYLDDVRYLSNGSSGRMGCALAEVALAAGHRVFLVLGPVAVTPPTGVVLRPVMSALQMQTAAEEAFAECDIAIAAAAVADYRPATKRPGKPARQPGPMTLDLIPNPDIVAGLAAKKGDRVVVGFALESEAAGMDAALARGEAKLRQKQLDLVVVNLSSAIDSDRSQVVLVDGEGRRRALPAQDKAATAAQIVAAAVELRQRRKPGVTS